MTTLHDPEQALREGDPAAALQQLQEEVRARPTDAKLRIFLFQLLAVLGQWERALAQLETAATLDASSLAMMQVYREAIRCEVLRTEVFAGRKSPLILGRPEPWLAFLTEALIAAGRGQAAEAEKLRKQAYDQAEPAAGILDGQPFAWIADADSRLGPVLELIIDGRYYWAPFSHLREVVIEKPADLRDIVWMPAHLQFANGAESVALIPTRYPDSLAEGDPLLVLSRKTVWRETGSGAYQGLGQRMLATDCADMPLMDIRKISIDPTGQGGNAGVLAEAG